MGIGNHEISDIIVFVLVLLPLHTHTDSGGFDLVVFKCETTRGGITCGKTKWPEPSLVYEARQSLFAWAFCLNSRVPEPVFRAWKENDGGLIREGPGLAPVMGGGTPSKDGPIQG